MTVHHSLICNLNTWQEIPEATWVRPRELRWHIYIAIPDGDPLIRLRGLPVFKIRCRTGEDKGLRSGARIIYYKNDSKIIALYIYLKSDRNVISDKEIMKILKINHLYE
ncbi:MAG: hypothetical protein OXF08_02930 [Bacteroidetes bacterium]|nr:hypothetical protein [Bacteroidota bacterium]